MTIWSTETRHYIKFQVSQGPSGSLDISIPVTYTSELEEGQGAYLAVADDAALAEAATALYAVLKPLVHPSAYSESMQVSTETVEEGALYADETNPAGAPLSTYTHDASVFFPKGEGDVFTAPIS